MKRFESIKKKIYSTALLMPAALLATAQNATAAAPEEKSNLLAILLTIVAIVLAFIIGGLGQVLISVSRLALEKHKNGGKLLAILFMAGLLLSSQTGMAQAADAAVTAAADAPNYGGLSANNYYAFVFVLAIEIAAILFLTFSIRRVYQELLPEKVKAAHRSKLAEWWSMLDKKIFTRAIPVEKEADVMLDHDYDGIKELDNALPPWWKYGFYITIVVAFIYIFLFHVSGDGKNPTQEYAAEMEQAQIEKEAYEANNKDKVDENNVPMADASGITEGKDLYTAKCWACHGKAGEGGAGPNLTDDYWIHKGSLNDIFKSIKVGYQDKGMQSWAKEFTPKQISHIASFIKTLQGTNPANAKAPQGDIFTETAVADSTTAAQPADTTKLPVPADKSTAKTK